MPSAHVKAVGGEPRSVGYRRMLSPASSLVVSLECRGFCVDLLSESSDFLGISQ